MSQPAPIYCALTDRTDLHEVLEDFVGTADAKRARLAASYSEGDVSGLGDQAHQLKGAGAGYGFPGLSEVAAQLEDACRRNDVDAVHSALDQVLDYLGRMRV